MDALLKGRTGVLLPEYKGGDGQEMTVRVARDGSLVVVRQDIAWVMEGRVFGANMGVLTTPLTFLVYAANRPDAWLRVPDRTIIIPLYVGVTLEDAAGTDTEVRLSFCQNDIGNGTSTAAAAGPLNMRSDALFTSNVVARNLATADTTAETNPLEIKRWTYGIAEGTGNDARERHWSANEDGVPPTIVGPGSLIVYVAATTTQATGFVQVVWAEFGEHMLS